MASVNVTIYPEYEMVVPFAFIQDLRTTAFENFLLVSLYPFLICAYFVAVYCLWKDGLRSTVNKINLGVTSTMFALTTIYIVCDVLLLKTSFNAFFERVDDLALQRANYVEENLAFASFTTAMVIGDAIILWRAAVLCTWPRWARFLSAFIVVVQTVSWIVGNLFGLSLISEIITLGISLVATVAISRKAWQYRRMFRDKIAVVSRRSALESIFSVLTETGIAYTILWIIYIPSHLSSGSDTTFHQVVSNVMTIAAPLYPTCIVIIVACHKSQLEGQLTSIEPLTSPNTERLDLLHQSEHSEQGLGYVEFNPYELAQKNGQWRLYPAA
ncbi:hypothetical protein PENSPDRAFT_685140 [Peniophora sp. CONT]|nr:hypothetical protein PENSPDRAFT_685140 [Peniophora sp. CONT]